MARANRQLKILDIISKHDVDTQEELVDYLRSEGFSVTQATVSRDIKEMGIIKTLSSDGRHYKYTAQQTKEASAADKFLSMFKNTVVSIKSTGNLVVLKTETGSAGPAAELIDKLSYDEVLGVIAGDNTIFVAVDSLEHVDMIRRRLEDLLEANRLY
ncbi:MAG TPA: arginine repressor [Clostridiales bacterium]|nr:arginine repressor [Clostridiales bacterium]